MIENTILPPVVLIVPCFNEAKRLSSLAFLDLVDNMKSLSLLFVDDGSSDQTLSKLRALATLRPNHIEVMALPQNQGKAEAVRQGMLHALAGPADIVGFVDADLSTPPAELRRLTNLVRSHPYDVLMGSRVQLMGRLIERRSLRHYLGRIFATLASLSLRLPVYDTQCGSKFFRRTHALTSALAQPFTSRWAFDVELLARLLHPPRGTAPIPIDQIWEEPLLSWTDVAGSKLKLWTAVKTAFELLRMSWKLRRR